MHRPYGKTQAIFSFSGRVCRALILGMHDLHTVDKSQNRNNYNHRTVDNLVDGVDRYASIHRLKVGMNMQPHTSSREAGVTTASASWVFTSPLPLKKCPTASSSRLKNGIKRLTLPTGFDRMQISQTRKNVVRQVVCLFVIEEVPDARVLRHAGRLRQRKE